MLMPWPGAIFQPHSRKTSPDRHSRKTSPLVAVDSLKPLRPIFAGHGLGVFRWRLPVKRALAAWLFKYGLSIAVSMIFDGADMNHNRETT